MVIHPAFQFSYDQLYHGLADQVSQGYVSVKSDGPLLLFNYTDQCSFEKYWNEFTTLARGLILNTFLKKIEAIGFPKFFNWGEISASLPNLSFTTTEKVDGSMVICYYNRVMGSWSFATRGSFNSEQAIKASFIFNGGEVISRIGCCPPTCLDPSVCYIFEVIYPENRIVVNYNGKTQLVLLGAFNRETGEELDILSDKFPFGLPGPHIRLPKQYAFSSIDEIIACGSNIKGIDQEGVVVRYTNGYRIKIKYEDYIRLHRTISNITPLAIWDHIHNGDDLESILISIPEEFRKDFITIVDLLTKQGELFIRAAQDFNFAHKHLDRKSYALTVNSKIPNVVPSLCFKLYAGHSLTLRDVSKLIRPNNNFLEGFTPTSSMSRFVEEK